LGVFDDFRYGLWLAKGEAQRAPLAQARPR
jgi:hypothetical protein